jgi:hypothetical protein
MIERDREQIRQETKNCKAGKIDPDECASALKDYAAEIKELSFSQALKVQSPGNSDESNNVHKAKCHAPEVGQIESAGCAHLVEMYRESLRGETYECEIANLPAATCARVLPYFKARLANLGYSPE